MAAQRSTSLGVPLRSRRWHVDWWASVRIAFGVIWLIDGGLEWQPADFHNLLQLITAMSQGQPAPLAAVISAGQAVVAINPVLANAVLAALETAIGLGPPLRPRQPDAAQGAARPGVSPPVSPFALNLAGNRSHFQAVSPLPSTGTPLPRGSRVFFFRSPVSRRVSIGRGTRPASRSRRSPGWLRRPQARCQRVT